VIRTIAGHNNTAVKLARKLQKKKYRRELGLFVVEGLDLIESAARVGEEPVELLVRSDLLNRLPDEFTELAREDELDIGVCDPETLQFASGLAGAADVIGLFEAPSWNLGDLDLQGTVVYLHGVGDPGNVGTIVRSAVAFGSAGMIVSPGTADPYSPKAVRAGMGAQFLLRIVPEVSPADLAAKLDAEVVRGGARPTCIVADPTGSLDARELAEGLTPRTGVLLALGSERGGLPDLGPETRYVAIRQAAFDSLNVGMAATILLYELAASEPGRGASGQGQAGLLG
jgi:TrmH family RNA methyltransferase